MAVEFDTIIGLEVHCQLATKSKLFCGCPAQPEGYSSVSEVPPNLYSCPVCAGHPGTLPVLNETVVELAVRAGIATGSQIRERSIFARKNYFYPDLPKGYQITQYSLPICEHGKLAFQVEGENFAVAIVRIHIEEDAGKSVHTSAGTLINLNRAGVPLVEIVSAPEMTSPAQAGGYLRAMHSLLTSIGITDGNMQEGNFRCDANVSIMPRGASKFGTRVEIKNINSFRFVEKAIQHEIDRQTTWIRSGQKVVQETRLYDSDRDVTESMRSKEEAADYRYFPDPDLSPVIVSQLLLERVRREMPELPAQRKQRYLKVALSEAEADVIVDSPRLSRLFDATLQGHENLAQPLSVLTAQVVTRYPEVRFDAQHLVAAAEYWQNGLISATNAKRLVQLLATEGGSPEELLRKYGLGQISDEGALVGMVDQMLEANQAQVTEFISGKERVLGFLVGQVMKTSGGKANPGMIQSLIRRRISERGVK